MLRKFCSSSNWLIQNGYRCQTTIYLDFFNISCTSSMYSSSLGTILVLHVIKQLQFILFRLRHLRLGRSILVLAVRESHQWWIPSSWLPLLDSIRDLASPRFLLRFSLSWIPMYQTPFNIIVRELGTASFIIKHLQLKPCYRPSLTFCPS